MKTLRLLIAAFTLVFAFASCQKDFSFEAGNAKGTLLKTITGDCDGINVQGIYYKDTLLTSSNFIDVQVDFSKIGTYNIKSDTVNGYSFSATGNVTALGINTVRLVGSGKPIVDGFDVFTLTYNNTTCLFNVQVILGTGGGSSAAVYSFSTTGTTCTGATLAGTYTAGIAMTPANTVTIPVTVTTAGTYNITTAVNGVTFSGTGSLTTASTSVILTATGTTPTSTTAVISNFPVNSGTTTCGFDVTFATTPSAAVYTFDCGSSSPTINGNFQVSASTTGNYIDFPVIVTTAGSYNLSIAAVNGISFSGSGLLSVGTTTVRLYASGTPTSAAAPFSNFSVVNGTSSCMVTVPVTDGNISFVNGTTTFSFNFTNSADTTFNNNAPAPNTYDLDFGGQATASTTGETFDINISKLTPFTTGTLTVNQLATGIDLTATYVNAAGVVYDITSTGTTQTPGFTVNITSISTTRIQGTFSGTLTNGTGGTFQVNSGTFDLSLF